VSLKDWFQRLLKPSVPAGRIYEIPPVQDSPTSVPPGWTDDLSVALPDGRTPEELVDYVFAAIEEGRVHEALINDLCAEFQLSTEDAELVVDRVCGGIARAATGNHANCPDRNKDPLAWLSFQRAIDLARRPPSN